MIIKMITFVPWILYYLVIWKNSLNILEQNNFKFKFKDLINFKLIILLIIYIYFYNFNRYQVAIVLFPVINLSLYIDELYKKKISFKLKKDNNIYFFIIGLFLFLPIVYFLIFDKLRMTYNFMFLYSLLHNLMVFVLYKIKKHKN